MRFLRSFLLFLITVILFLIAFNYAASGVGRLPQDPVLETLKVWGLAKPVAQMADPRIQRALWTGAAALVVLVWLLSLAVWRTRPHALRTTAPTGDIVLIHPGALLKFVRLQVESHPAVVSDRVKIRQKGRRGLSILVNANVQPINSLPEIKDQLEASIRNGFSQVLGIEQIEDLTIILGIDEKSISTRPGPKGKAEAKPEPPVRGAMEGQPAPVVTVVDEGRPGKRVIKDVHAPREMNSVSGDRGLRDVDVDALPQSEIETKKTVADYKSQPHAEFLDNPDPVHGYHPEEQEPPNAEGLPVKDSQPWLDNRTAGPTEPPEGQERK